jgi:circadian clock protein KaiC
MRGFGWDISSWETEGKWAFIDVSPTPGQETVESGTYDLGALLARIENAIQKVHAKRVVIDSLGAIFTQLTNNAIVRRELFRIASAVKKMDVTATTASLMGGTSITETHISTITDSIILLRYVEMYGEMQRGITVLKMRGSKHEKDIRRFSIDGTGMHIREPFRNVTGILTGSPVYVAPTEIERIEDLFKDERVVPEEGSLG